MNKLSLGERMKAYEAATGSTLPPRMPIIVRVDGRAFHTLTRGSPKPFCPLFEMAMNCAAEALVSDVDGCKLAYIQSDEISLLIHPYQTLMTQPWFGGDVQKIVSTTAAVASVEFTDAFGRVGTFDSRVFVLPEADVCNYFLWRQQDAERNSTNGYAQTMFSHKQLLGKNLDTVKAMMNEIGFDWGRVDTDRKRGRCFLRGVGMDTQIPRFSQDRAYIEKHLECDVA